MCLLARRFAERGVRFVQVTHSDGNVQWDQHGDLKNGHEKNAREVDQPIAGLLHDLKARGLLGGHARLVGRRVRPHADRRRERTAATTTPKASPCGWPAAA